MLNQHQTIRDNIEKFNKPMPLVSHLAALIGNKKTVKIADLGSGAYSTIGSYLNGVEVDIYHSDNQDFSAFCKKYDFVPRIPIEYQDMEQLTYPDESFDIVHCANALDHTRDAAIAVEEMIRVCKPGGWVYIDSHLDQLDTGHKHYWNAKKDGVFTNDNAKLLFDLKDWGFKIKFIDRGGESRYNHIIATLQK